MMRITILSAIFSLVITQIAAQGPGNCGCESPSGCPGHCIQVGVRYVALRETIQSAVLAHS